MATYAILYAIVYMIYLDGLFLHPMRGKSSARISEQSMGARNLVGIGFVVAARQATLTGGIESLESNPGLLKSFKIQEPPEFFNF
jgi:hypothetical protein